MNRIVRCIVALAILVSSCGQTMAQSPVSVAQNPLAGSRVFGAKGCVKCHAVNGVGGTPVSYTHLTLPTNREV